MKRKKTTKASKDGNKTIQRQTSISDSLNAIKSNSQQNSWKEYKVLNLCSIDNIKKINNNTHYQKKQIEKSKTGKSETGNTQSSTKDTQSGTTTHGIRKISSTNKQSQYSGTASGSQKQGKGKVNSSTEIEQNKNNFSTEPTTPSGMTIYLTTTRRRKAVKSLADTCKNLKRRRIPLPPMCKNDFTGWN